MTRTIIERAIFILILACLIPTSLGQEQRKIDIRIPFAQSQWEVNTKEGYSALIQLHRAIEALKSDSLNTIKSITITGYASPDGGESLNEYIADLRAEYLEDFLCNVIAIPATLIENRGGSIDWAQLAELVAGSNMEYRDEVLSIIESQPSETWSKVNPNDRWLTLTDSRNKRLMDLAGGEPYRYMAEHFFPEMRSGGVITLYTHSLSPRQEIQLADTIEDTIGITITETPVQDELEAIEKVVTKEQSADIPTPEVLYDYRPFMAIKTNLLYNLALIPNLELEFILSPTLSLNAEFGRGWWLNPNNGFSWQAQTYSLEGRYWLGDRQELEHLNGWFIGAFALHGYYDFQLKPRNGTQIDAKLGLGISLGYSMELSKSLNLEFSAGAGYLIYEYQDYFVEGGERLIADGARIAATGILPLKAKVSLVWKIKSRVKRGGGYEN